MFSNGLTTMDATAEQTGITDFVCQNSLDTDESGPPNKIFNGQKLPTEKLL